MGQRTRRVRLGDIFLDTLSGRPILLCTHCHKDYGDLDEFHKHLHRCLPDKTILKPTAGQQRQRNRIDSQGQEPDEQAVIDSFRIEQEVHDPKWFVGGSEDNSAKVVQQKSATPSTAPTPANARQSIVRKRPLNAVPFKDEPPKKIVIVVKSPSATPPTTTTRNTTQPSQGTIKQQSRQGASVNPKDSSRLAPPQIVAAKASVGNTHRTNGDVRPVAVANPVQKPTTMRIEATTRKEAQQAIAGKQAEKSTKQTVVNVPQQYGDKRQRISNPQPREQQPKVGQQQQQPHPKVLQPLRRQQEAQQITAKSEVQKPQVQQQQQQKVIHQKPPSNPPKNQETATLVKRLQNLGVVVQRTKPPTEVALENAKKTHTTEIINRLQANGTQVKILNRTANNNNSNSIASKPAVMKNVTPSTTAAITKDYTSPTKPPSRATASTIAKNTHNSSANIKKFP